MLRRINRESDSSFLSRGEGGRGPIPIRTSMPLLAWCRDWNRYGTIAPNSGPHPTLPLGGEGFKRATALPLPLLCANK